MRALINFLEFQGGRLFEGGRSLTFWDFRVGAYLRWAVNRIKTVCLSVCYTTNRLGLA